MNINYKIIIILALIIQGCIPHREIADRDIMEVASSYKEIIDSTNDRPKTTIKNKYDVKDIAEANTTTGTISNSFYGAFNMAGGSPVIAKKVVAAMASKINFSVDLNSGDTFSIITVGDDVIYIEFNLKKKGKIISYGSTIEGKNTFFDRYGSPIDNGLMKYPLKYERVSSGFSKHRWHPILKKYTAHNGIDLVAKYGTPVMSVGDGIIEVASRGKRAGRYVKISHRDGMETMYAHLSRIRCHSGQTIKKGGIIGYVGNSGMSTGTHLHFEYRVNGIPTDPKKIKSVSLASLSELEMAAIKNKVAAIISVKRIASISKR